MQHSKKKTKLDSAQPQQQAPRPVQTQPQSAPTVVPQPKQVVPQPQPASQPKPQPAPSQNLMADIMSGKISPQQVAPKPTPKAEQPQPTVAQPVEKKPEVRKTYISNKDKFEALSQENPLLLDLKKKFDLNLN